MASEASRPPNIEVGDLTDNDLRASAVLHTQLAASLREVLRLRTSSHEASHELSELKQKLHNAERTSEESQNELNACQARLHAVENELQQTKCELTKLKSGMVDMEFRLEGSKASLEAAQRLLGEYVLKIAQLQSSEQPVPEHLTQMDASAATVLTRKRARSPSLEIIEPFCPSPGRVSVKKSSESTLTTAVPSNRKCLPTPASSSDLEGCSVVAAKRRKVGVKDEVMDFKVENSDDLKSNQPSNITPYVNGIANRDISTNPPPRTPPVTSLSSDLESPLNHQAKETTDPTDLESARTDHHSSTPAPSSPFTNLRDPGVRTGLSPSTDTTNVPPSNRPTPTTLAKTSTNSSPTERPPQAVTTTANVPLSSTPSASTTSVDRSGLSQSGPTNPASVQMPSVLTSTSLNKVSFPSKGLANIIRDAPFRMRERPSPPNTTNTGNTGVHPNCTPPPNSASTVPTGCRNANSQSQLPHNMGEQTSHPSFTAPASTTIQRSSLMSAKPESRPPTSKAEPPTSVPQPFRTKATRKVYSVEYRPWTPRLSSEANLNPKSPCDQRLTPSLASMVQKYLPSTKAEIFPILPSPLTTEVPRAFLRNMYGGSDQQFLQIFRKNKHPAGVIQRRVVFPQFGLNPAMPSAPGHPGLLFTSRQEILENPPWTVFRKVSGSGQAVWLYLGDYEDELAGKMTGKEYSDLATSVKREWAKSLLGVKKFKVYVSMRARIALRKAGCIPLEDKAKEEALIDDEINAVQANNGRPVNVDDVVEALERGDEGLDIIRMVCTHYDHAFAKDMEQKLVVYKGSASAGSGPSHLSTSKSTRTSTPASSSSAAAPNAPVLLQDRPLPRYRDLFEEESEAEENGEQDSDYELDISLPKASSDRELRPRASRAIALKLRD